MDVCFFLVVRSWHPWCGECMAGITLYQWTYYTIDVVCKACLALSHCPSESEHHVLLHPIMLSHWTHYWQYGFPPCHHPHPSPPAHRTSYTTPKPMLSTLNMIKTDKMLCQQTTYDVLYEITFNHRRLLELPWVYIYYWVLLPTLNELQWLVL